MPHCAFRPPPCARRRARSSCPSLNATQRGNSIKAAGDLGDRGDDGGDAEEVDRFGREGDAVSHAARHCRLCLGRGQLDRGGAELAHDAPGHVAAHADGLALEVGDRLDRPLAMLTLGLECVKSPTTWAPSCSPIFSAPTLIGSPGCAEPAQGSGDMKRASMTWVRVKRPGIVTADAEADVEGLVEQRSNCAGGGPSGEVMISKLNVPLVSASIASAHGLICQR